MKEGKELYKKAELPAGAHVEPCPVCGADAELWQYSKDFKNGPIDKVVLDLYPPAPALGTRYQGHRRVNCRFATKQ